MKHSYLFFLTFLIAGIMTNRDNINQPETEISKYKNTFLLKSNVFDAS